MSARAVMPGPARWAVRLSLLWLLAGSLVGAWLLAAGAGWMAAPGGRWLLAHADWMRFGWMTQFALGVACWILPRLPREPKFGPALPMIGGFVVLNVGLLLVTLGLLFAGRLLVVAGLLGVLFSLQARLRLRAGAR